jgi:hypothetical protein
MAACRDLEWAVSLVDIHQWKVEDDMPCNALGLRQLALALTKRPDCCCATV